MSESKRYEQAVYRRCGRSGLKLPLISLGLWHNFGDADRYDNSRRMILEAFDLGMTHFDLANNYGPPPGAAEGTFGRVFHHDLASHRDELIVSTKAGFRMWPGPYGEWGSRKNLLASLDRSLERMGLDYVDIFYSHRPDPDTPMEETMGALDTAVRSGKALYAGISNYSPEQTQAAIQCLQAAGTPCLIHQCNYSLLHRAAEDGLLDVLETAGVGMIAFCPLAQGLLTTRYLDGIPEDSRGGRPGTFLKSERITPEIVAKARALNSFAKERGQTLAQMALAWVIRDTRVTSALIGASRPEQIRENALILRREPRFTADECARIDAILATSLQNTPWR